MAIKVISVTRHDTFEEKLGDFLSKYPNAKILYITAKGSEAGKGLLAVLSFNEIPEVRDDLTLQETENYRDMLGQANSVLAEKEAELKAEAAEKAKLEKQKLAAEAKLQKEKEAKAKQAEEIKSLEAKLKELKATKTEV